MSILAFPRFADAAPEFTSADDASARSIPFEPLTFPSRASAAARASPASAAETRDLAFAEGYSAGRADGVREVDDLVAAEHARGEARVVAARADWVRDEAERLAAIIETRLADIVSALRREVAALLEACVERAVEVAIVERVTDQVERALARSNRPHVTITGRTDLAEALLSSLTTRRIAASIESVASARPDLRVAFADTVIVADLQSALSASPKAAP